MSVMRRLTAFNSLKVYNKFLPVHLHKCFASDLSPNCEEKTLWVPPHMNELPCPCGPWAPWYASKQAFYNKVLGAGIVSLIAAFLTAFLTGSLYLNFGPPYAQPFKPSPPTMVDEQAEGPIGLPPC